MKRESGKREGGNVATRGVTLLELLVVLVLLGVMFSVSGLALASLGTPKSSARVRVLEGARAQAIRSGVPVLVSADSLPASHFPLPPSPFPSPVLFLPDGRALGPGVDPLTGAPVATR